MSVGDGKAERPPEGTEHRAAAPLGRLGRSCGALEAGDDALFAVRVFDGRVVSAGRVSEGRVERAEQSDVLLDKDILDEAHAERGLADAAATEQNDLWGP